MTRLVTHLHLHLEYPTKVQCPTAPLYLRPQPQRGMKGIRPDPNFPTLIHMGFLVTQFVMFALITAAVRILNRRGARRPENLVALQEMERRTVFAKTNEAQERSIEVETVGALPAALCGWGGLLFTIFQFTNGLYALVNNTLAWQGYMLKGTYVVPPRPPKLHTHRSCVTHLRSSPIPHRVVEASVLLFRIGGLDLYRRLPLALVLSLRYLIATKGEVSYYCM